MVCCLPIFAKYTSWCVCPDGDYDPASYDDAFAIGNSLYLSVGWLIVQLKCCLPAIDAYSNVEAWRQDISAEN